MNNSLITQFLSKNEYTEEDLLKYINQHYNSTTSHLFGIYIQSNNNYIGNIKLDNIDFKDKIADIGLFIGDQGEWGKGYGTEAISIISEFAFNQLNLLHIIAGINNDNKASIKSFIKNGFVKENLYKINIDGYWLRKNNPVLTKDIKENHLNFILDIFANNLKIEEISLLMTKENTPQWNEINHSHIIDDLEKVLQIKFTPQEINMLISIQSVILITKKYYQGDTH